MKTENTPVSDAASCCGAPAAPAAAPLALGGGQLFRIATMDCSAEESEIRRALEPIGGIRSLGFQLGARTLRIEAAEDAYPLALEAIRKAGFNPQPASSDAMQRKPVAMRGTITIMVTPMTTAMVTVQQRGHPPCGGAGVGRGR
jgi:cation transport ATPase